MMDVIKSEQKKVVSISLLTTVINYHGQKEGWFGEIYYHGTQMRKRERSYIPVWLYLLYGWTEIFKPQRCPQNRKAVFIVRHVESKPEEPSPPVLPECGSPLSSNGTVAEAMLFSSGFDLDAWPLFSLVAAYLLLMASLLEPYLLVSFFLLVNGFPFVSSLSKLEVAFIFRPFLS